MTEISEDDFMTEWEPLTPPGQREVDTNWLWAWEDARHEDLHHVWTVVEGDDPDWAFASPGFHLVNRVDGRDSYVVTKKPWVTGDELGVWWEPVYDYHDFEEAERDDWEEPDPEDECQKCLRERSHVAHQGDPNDRPIVTGPEVP
jgi:hypothetical protein